MYPEQFDYYRAGSIDEALELMDDHSDRDTTLLSGGHSLIPTMKSGLADPEVLIDIGDIDEMTGIDREGDALTIGASTRYTAIVNDDEVQDNSPVLAEATRQIGDTQVRNRGTIGGNIAHSDPASDLPAAILATDATVYAHSSDGERAINADDFFLGVYMTALEPGEILTRIEVPILKKGAGTYAKKPSPSSGYAIVGVAARLETDGDIITSAGVAANGVMDHAVRLEAVESTLEGETPSVDTTKAAAERATDDLDTVFMMSDVQASGEYRAQLLKAYTEEALQQAIERL